MLICHTSEETLRLRRLLGSPSHVSPVMSSNLKPSLEFSITSQKVVHFDVSRRIGTIATLGTVLLSAADAIFSTEIAHAFGFRMTEPEQTLEEAQHAISGHVRDLLQVKSFIESESWKEAQKALRRSSALLKQDLYTIIQGKPGNERPRLRELYSYLFNNVTRLDYAARDKDAELIQECYKNIVVALDDILARI
ncbi:Oxygen-evolving enhancer protein 3 [Dillenia turbinata]|uniref:Oxygen-evolving enhancer protein 3 n=1 Tax=Dillenia turbinata TaxID=194707 RepID=A0AAN8VZ45_9MAGN